MSVEAESGSRQCLNASEIPALGSKFRAVLLFGEWSVKTGETILPYYFTSSWKGRKGFIRVREYKLLQSGFDLSLLNLSSTAINIIFYSHPIQVMLRFEQLMAQSI